MLETSGAFFNQSINQSIRLILTWPKQQTATSRTTEGGTVTVKMQDRCSRPNDETSALIFSRCLNVSRQKVNRSV